MCDRNGWILHHQPDLRSHRYFHVLLLHPAGGTETAGVTLKGMAGSHCKTMMI